jgi:hypothetical protein
VGNKNIQHNTMEMDYKREIEEDNIMEDKRREGVEELMQCNAMQCDATQLVRY